LRLLRLDAAGQLDLAIDGADQIRRDGWLIKGGAAHTREKIIATASSRFVVIASAEKLVDRLNPPVPIEIVAFAPATTMGAIGSTRLRTETPLTPDGGYIADSWAPTQTHASSPAGSIVNQE
jgi:ribose 5-phosphate isomerase A